MLDLVPVLDHRVSVDSRAWSGAKAPFTVIRELRRARYEIAFDLQGLIKSAALARLSGASRVVGYTTKHLREPAARLFYTEQVNPRVDEAEEEDEAEASGRGGYRAPALATVARARTTTVLHMVDRSVAALRAIGINRPYLRFPLDEPPSPAPACARQLLGLWPDEPFALINPGGGVAEQAVAGGALRRAGARSAGAPRVEIGGAVGTGGRNARRARGGGVGRRGGDGAADDGGRHDRAGPRRPAADLRRYRSDPPRGRGRHGRGRHLRADRSAPQRAVESRGRLQVRGSRHCACHHQRRCRIAQVYRGAPRRRRARGGASRTSTLNDVLDAVARRLLASPRTTRPECVNLSGDG